MPVNVKGKLILDDPVLTVICTLLTKGTGKGMLQVPTAFTMLGPTTGNTIPLVVKDPPIVPVLALM